MACYEVSIGTTFEAHCPADAVRQMADWLLAEGAREGFYRVADPRGLDVMMTLHTANDPHGSRTCTTCKARQAAQADPALGLVAIPNLSTGTSGFLTVGDLRALIGYIEQRDRLTGPDGAAAEGGDR